MIDAALGVYNALSSNGKPLGDLEFTVLASIGLRIDAGVANTAADLNIVISLATGTRSAGLSVIDAPGRLVKDSHAEVLAKRAFNIFIIETLAQLDRQPEFEDDILCIFNKQSVCSSLPQYCIKPGYSFHLFISDSPCGDSCIYKLSTGTLAFTGAKLICSESPEVLEKIFDVHNETLPTIGGMRCVRESGEQSLSCLRLKPGRSDIADRSASMSCSDKVARWLVLGLQGKILSSIVGRIPLSSVSVGLDPLASSAEEQLAALHRSLVDRLPCLHDSQRIPSLHVIDMDNRFPHGKQAVAMKYQQGQQQEGALERDGQPAKKRRKKDVFPCSTSLNCLLDLSVYFQCMNRQKLLCEGLPRKCYNNNVEILVGNEGLLQGCTLMSSQEKYSRLSRLSMRHWLADRIGAVDEAKQTLTLDTNNYQVWKHHQLTKLESHPLNSRYREYLKNEAAFFQHASFKDWVHSSTNPI
ncbi:hypothetical protein EON65_15480 [archaeon]|nr:MAG: hypothetical protein EON65_15480 [archaeon]